MQGTDTLILEGENPAKLHLLMILSFPVAFHRSIASTAQDSRRSDTHNITKQSMKKKIETSRVFEWMSKKGTLFCPISSCETITH